MILFQLLFWGAVQETPSSPGITGNPIRPMQNRGNNAPATDSRPPPDLADTWRSHASGNAADAKPRSKPPNEGHS